MSDANDFEPNKLRIKKEVNHKEKGWQMPANLVATEFGEVNVRQNGAEVAGCYVEFTIAMEPQGRFAEGWRTGVALDASASMKRSYGRKVEARVDPELLTDYIKQGRLRSYMEDGEPTRKIEREAFEEMQERGYKINFTENILQPIVQDFTAYLAGSLDKTGKTSIIYWGCGKGDEIKALGEFDANSCQKLAIAGPATFQLGKTTMLLPAIAFFTKQNNNTKKDIANSYSHAQQGIYIFLTDGRIDDLEQVKNYTKELALEIAVGKRNYLKLILIGIGNDVDRYQLQELDDFDTGLDIDLWDYKIASEMTSLSQIFAEVVNENQIIAENGSIYDEAGTLVKSYPKGLPARVDFVMRHDSRWFELEVGNQRIRQSVTLSAVAIAPLTQKKLFDFEIKAQERGDVLGSGDRKLDDREFGDRQIEQEQSAIQSYSWKWLAALLIGVAFIGTAIAFGFLSKRSEDNKLQKTPMPSVSKESETKPKSASINKSNNNPLANSSTNPSTNSPNSSSSTNSNAINSNSPEKFTINKPENISGKVSGNGIQKEANNNSEKASEKATENISNKVSSSKVSSSKINNSENSNNSNNLTKSINSVSPTKKSDRNISTSILPIANPDVEAIVFFSSDESQLTFNEETKIDNFWTKVQGRRGIIQVSGHADSTGDYGYNLDLSQSRANEVVRLLRDRGLDNNYKVIFEALSWLQPLRKNFTATDQALNRRVVIQFKEQK